MPVQMLRVAGDIVVLNQNAKTTWLTRLKKRVMVREHLSSDKQQSYASVR